VICGPIDLSPYASSEGITNSHLSPSDINCMASVQPLITWFGANFVGSPRLYEESNSSPCCLRKSVCACEKKGEREHARAIVNTSSQNEGVARASQPNRSLFCTFPSKNVLSNIEKVQNPKLDRKSKIIETPVVASGSTRPVPRWSSLGSGTNTACSLSVSVLLSVPISELCTATRTARWSRLLSRHFRRETLSRLPSSPLRAFRRRKRPRG